MEAGRDPHGPADTSRSPRARRWLATSFSFGPLADLEHRFDPLDAHVKYVCWGAETCPETQRQHVHYYIRFDQATTRGRVQELIGDQAANCQVCKGNDQQNHDYVFKDDCRLLGPWELGRMLAGEEGQGKRTDIDDLVDGVKAGKTDRQLCEEHPKAMMKYAGHVARFRAASASPQMRDVSVMACVGPTAIGKTHWAYQIPDIFTTTWKNGMLTFDGYQGEDAILIDEFTGQVPIEFMLRILDKWPLRIDVKYSNVPACWTKVWISSNTHPRNWYGIAPERQQAALLRRITWIVEAETREELQAKMEEAREAAL